MRKKKKGIVSKGKIKNATRLEINGITFRSKLEAFTYQKLKENGINDFEYENNKFVLQHAFTFTSRSTESFEKTERSTGTKLKGFGETKPEIREITYLPDFCCIDPFKKTGWIIECKGYSNDAFPIKLKMFKKMLTDQGFNIDYYLPNNQGNVLKSIEAIKTKYYTK